MDRVRFTPQQIGGFRDRMQTCLSDPACRKVFGEFASTLVRPPVKIGKLLELWDLAGLGSFDEDAAFDLIYEINGFNENPLLSLSEPHEKVRYIKEECCRQLTRYSIHKNFITYLQAKHSC